MASCRHESKQADVEILLNLALAVTRQQLIPGGDSCLCKRTRGILAIGQGSVDVAKHFAFNVNPTIK
eukprot:jgi/Picsp_1/6202/NSC_03556-R1_---NA---